MDARYWIERLEMLEHPEGGFFRETYRSAESIPSDGLPKRFAGSRSFSTAIYFLITGLRPSRFHRLNADEIWHFYQGAPLTLHLLHPDGAYQRICLGRNPEKGECFQAVVPAGCWFGAEVQDREAFSLVGCTVAPGFDFSDFILADRSELLQLFPKHASLIEQLTVPDTINQSFDHNE